MARYRDSDDLGPLDDPHESGARCIELVRNCEDWEDQVSGLVLLRQLAINHEDILAQDGARYKALVGYTLQCLDSLRSQVSKNAALTLMDLFERVNPEVNAALAALLVPALLKRSGDNTNGFIRTQAKAALRSFCRRIPEHETLIALEAALYHKGASQRALAATFISLCLDSSTRINLQGELCQRIADKCESLSRDPSPEVRRSARPLVASIMGDSVQTPKGGPDSEAEPGWSGHITSPLRRKMVKKSTSRVRANGKIKVTPNRHVKAAATKPKQQMPPSFLPRINTRVNQPNTKLPVSNVPKGKFQADRSPPRKRYSPSIPKTAAPSLPQVQQSTYDQEYLSPTCDAEEPNGKRKLPVGDQSVFNTANSSPWARDISDFTFRYPDRKNLGLSSITSAHRGRVFVQPQRVNVVPVETHSHKATQLPWQQQDDVRDNCEDFNKVLQQERQWREHQSLVRQQQLAQIESQEQQVISEIHSLDQALAKIQAHCARRHGSAQNQQYDAKRQFNIRPHELSSLGASVYLKHVTDSRYGDDKS